MSVIVELSVPPSEFELGRTLQMEGHTTIHLETMAHLEGRSVLCFWMRRMRIGFIEAVRAHPAVAALQIVTTHGEKTLYALDWEPSEDTFFATIVELDAHVLEATGGTDSWLFKIRLPSHDSLSKFQQICFDANIPLDIKRIYNPTRPAAGPRYGLTTTQRQTLTRAVEEGYYAIPRDISTKALAEHYDISDQAVTERLRRAIDTLTRNTLLLTQEDDSSR